MAGASASRTSDNQRDCERSQIGWPLSPFEVMIGEPPPYPLDAVLGVDFGLDAGDSDGGGPSQAVEDHCANLSVALAEMVSNVALARARRQERNLAETAGRRVPDVEIGDYYYVLVLARIRRHKLQMKCGWDRGG